MLEKFGSWKFVNYQKFIYHTFTLWRLTQMMDHSREYYCILSAQYFEFCCSDQFSFVTASGHHYIAKSPFYWSLHAGTKSSEDSQIRSEWDALHRHSSLVHYHHWLVNMYCARKTCINKFIRKCLMWNRRLSLKDGRRKEFKLLLLVVTFCCNSFPCHFLK